MTDKIEVEILDSETGKVLFYISNRHANNYLYDGAGNAIATCIGGDYKEKFGDIHGWLKNILKREDTRLQKITDTILQLQTERQRRLQLTEDIHKCAEQKKSQKN